MSTGLVYPTMDQPFGRGVRPPLGAPYRCGIVDWQWLREDVRNGSLAAPGTGFGGSTFFQPWSVELSTFSSNRREVIQRQSERRRASRPSTSLRNCRK